MIVLLFFLLGGLGGLLAGFLFALPFLLCGIVCFVFHRRVGLWCAWAVYLSVDLYLRYATGINWTVVFRTAQWEASMNYARLAIGWVQFLAILVLVLVMWIYPRLDFYREWLTEVNAEYWRFRIWGIQIVGGLLDWLRWGTLTAALCQSMRYLTGRRREKR